MESSPMFMGTYNHAVDPKGRIIIPGKLRKGLGDSFVVTRGWDECLYAYPIAEWERVAANFMANVPDNTKNGRELKRFFLSGACECELDKQGRILLPSHLREYAGLEKESVFIGMMNKVEIWSKGKYKTVDSYEDMEKMSDSMADFDVRF